MTTMRFLGGAIFLFVVSGCSYHTEVGVSPAYNVYSSYDKPIPGRWALYVDSQKLGALVVEVDSFGCGVHDFSMDIAAPFRKSVVETMSVLVEEIELIEAPSSMEELSGGDHLGQMVILANNFDAKIRFDFRANAEVELEVSIIVAGLENSLLEATVSSEGNSVESTVFCGGGANALANAAEEAIEEVLERLGERVSNSRKIREYTDNVDIDTPRPAPKRDLHRDARLGVDGFTVTYSRGL